MIAWLFYLVFSVISISLAIILSTIALKDRKIKEGQFTLSEKDYSLFLSQSDRARNVKSSGFTIISNKSYNKFMNQGQMLLVNDGFKISIPEQR